MMIYFLLIAAAGTNTVWLGVLNDHLSGEPSRGCFDNDNGYSRDCRGTFSHIMGGAPIDHNVIISDSEFEGCHY